MIRVWVSEADEMKRPLADNIENVRARFAWRGMRIYQTEATSRKGDNNRVSAPGFVKINL